MMRLNRNPAKARAPVLVTVIGCVVAFTPATFATPLQELSPQRLAEPKNVFEKPAYAALQVALTKPIIALFQAKQYADAEKSLRRLIDQFPTWPVHHYNLAAALARQDKRDDALERLDVAIETGFRNWRAMERDSDFETLRPLPRFQELLAKSKASAGTAAGKKRLSIKPSIIREGRARIDASNTAWEPRSNTLIAAFRFSKRAAAAAIAGGDDAMSRRLNTLFEKGMAAGNQGDLYDNRDDGHSRLSKAAFPQIAHVEYDPIARGAGVHYGLGSYFLFNQVTFGNSSTAVTGGHLWRSQARLALTSPAHAAHIYRQYANNHLYVYPEHSDHDAGRGDLLPSNTPYMTISQGSSGSDQPFLRAIAVTLAAFQPDVKAFLRRNRLVAPTVQMILRYGQKFVASDEDYLSGKAHPSVFSGEELDPLKMIERANAVRIDDVPPMVKLNVVEESHPVPGIDYFGPRGLHETLFNTPSVVARLVRSTRYAKRLVVDAGKTKDPNGRPLTFRWIVLRGDPERIGITPLNKSGTKVELRVPWHERRPVPHAPDLSTDRVDIGVFAHNGARYSAPAFITFHYPADQARLYTEAGQIRQVDYASASHRNRYVDPALFPARDWRDIYEYDDAGGLVGWKRIRGGGIQSFTRHGLKITERDSHGRPKRAERVTYKIVPNKAGRMKIVQEPSGTFGTYSYKGPNDRFGTLEVTN